ncbi:ABC transporter ATP-binding protein [Pseudomonas citronellolis]|uniref:ABC transporter ATP-binding protein n=1 Tax=Pseudomonas citronellolis TaxID=53408 RepID=UPI0021C0D462|nr:hypothetical protein [Pseudomonas citronellolis]UXJ50328.1 hypothetical protein N5P21_20315 [Pseudomonas citronellolis]
MRSDALELAGHAGGFRLKPFLLSARTSPSPFREEAGPTEVVLRNPQHPYTQRLLASVPQLPAEGRPTVAQLAPASVDLAPPFEERWLWGLAV